MLHAQAAWALRRLWLIAGPVVGVAWWAGNLLAGGGHVEVILNVSSRRVARPSTAAARTPSPTLRSRCHPVDHMTTHTRTRQTTTPRVTHVPSMASPRDTQIGCGSCVAGVVGIARGAQQITIKNWPRNGCHPATPKCTEGLSSRRVAFATAPHPTCECTLTPIRFYSRRVAPVRPL